ncbi:MAG: transposase [Streptomyces sp.]|nr:transposase [Streptomyces sp.]
MLELSPSTYCARKTRAKSARRLRDEELIPLVTAVWEDSGRTYGARKVTRALVRAGHMVARCMVERLMRELGIEGVIRGRAAAPRSPSQPLHGHRTWSTATSRPNARTSCGWPT